MLQYILDMENQLKTEAGNSASIDIAKDVPNAEILAAIEEVQAMKKDPNKRLYSSFAELLEEVKAQDADPLDELDGFFKNINQTHSVEEMNAANREKAKDLFGRSTKSER